MRFPLPLLLSVVSALDCPDQIPVGSVYYTARTVRVADTKNGGAFDDLTMHVKMAYETQSTMKIEVVTHNVGLSGVTTEMIVGRNMQYMIARKSCAIVFEEEGAKTNATGAYRREGGSSGTSSSYREDSPSVLEMEVSEFLAEMLRREPEDIAVGFVNNANVELTKIVLSGKFSLSKTRARIDMQKVYDQYISGHTKSYFRRIKTGSRRH